MNAIWKDDWQQTMAHYLAWWNRKGLVISMWGYIPEQGAAHEIVEPPPCPKDPYQYWFDPNWRARHIHYQLSRSYFGADIIPVADTNLGPGSLAAILGATLEPGEDTIWIKPNTEIGDQIIFDEQNHWWQIHLQLLQECKMLSQGRYFVGCPDLCEGLDVLVGLRGAEAVFLDMKERPALLEQQLQKINQVYFYVFDRIYELIQVDGKMAFCYFSIWGPGKIAKLQCDVSAMISVEDFGRFVVPFLQQQCNFLDYPLYHLDGVEALRHLDLLLSIDDLKAIQWTPGAGKPQGGDPCWYELYNRILRAGKAVMASWVGLDQLKPLLDHVGPNGLHVLMDFRSQRDVEYALDIAEQYRRI